MSIRSAVKKLIPSGVFSVIEPYGHLAEAVAYNMKYGFPAKGMKVIGVTGTNGKTTTSYMIHRMLVNAGYKAGLMTTVAYGIGDDIRSQIHHMTNVPIPELMARLKWMRSQGVEWLVLETTSHALAQHRVWGVPYSVAVLTNVTHEHLDYHKTFERYRDAKRRLFKLAATNANGLRTGIVNGDDPSAALFAADVPNAIVYTVENVDKNTTMQLRATDGRLLGASVKASSEGSAFTASFQTISDTKLYGLSAPLHGGEAGQFQTKRTLQLRVRIPGQFNVSNGLAAAGVGIALGLTNEQIEQGIAALDSVEGRMTTISEGQDYSVIVDFAHTPDSFEKLFKDLQPVVHGADGRLLVMFGSAGRRDEAKRAVQGALAGEYADVVVVTEEDDRDTDGLEIMNQIAAGAESKGKIREQNLFLVHDRTEAIRYTVGLAHPGDTVLLLGKGHEKTIERADGENPWDEIGAAREAVRQRS